MQYIVCIIVSTIVIHVTYLWCVVYGVTNNTPTVCHTLTLPCYPASIPTPHTYVIVTASPSWGLCASLRDL
jgi:hypothetical protein